MPVIPYLRRSAIVETVIQFIYSRDNGWLGFGNSDSNIENVYRVFHVVESVINYTNNNFHMW